MTVIECFYRQRRNESINYRQETKRGVNTVRIQFPRRLPVLEKCLFVVQLDAVDESVHLMKDCMFCIGSDLAPW